MYNVYFLVMMDNSKMYNVYFLVMMDNRIKEDNY